MADPSESFYDIVQHIREMHTIRVSKEDGLPSIPTRSHMVQSALELNP